MRHHGFTLLAAALFLGSCDDRRDPPMDSRGFSQLMGDTQKHFRPQVDLHLCNRGPFGNHTTDRKDHLSQPARETVMMKLDDYSAGSVDLKGSAESQEAALKDFAALAKAMVPYPKREGEDQLYRRVKIDADPGIPESLIERLVTILKSIGARNITRATTTP